MARSRIPVRTEFFTFTLGSTPEPDIDRKTGKQKTTDSIHFAWKANVVMSSDGWGANIITVKCDHQPITMPLGTRLDIDDLAASPWAFIDEETGRLVSGVTYYTGALEPHPDVADAALAYHREANGIADDEDSEATSEIVEEATS